MMACSSKPTSNKEMAALLSSLEEKAFQSLEYPYANELRAQNLFRITSAIPYNVPFKERLQYLEELLHAGKTKQCIEECEKVIKAAFPDEKITYESRPYFELLALAYLRYGEEVNCIEQHNSSSCIVPIQGNGIHEDIFGSSHASNIYEKLIAYDDNDLESRWLYTIAQMTLGKYEKGELNNAAIPLSAFKSDTAISFFKDVAHHKGVGEVGHAGGSIMEDFNNDGLLDLFTTSYLLGDQCRLFLQNANGTFDDVTKQAGLEGITGGLNTLQADYNNDGFVDILITRGGWLQKFGKIPNSLLMNNGDGTFEDVTVESGLLSYHPTQTAAWADYNLDGHLDLFIGNESTFANGHPSEFYENQGDGTFINLAESLDLDITGFIKGVFWGDYNNDMYPDLYVSILGEKNLLFMNREGKEHARFFEEIAERAGVEEPIYSFPGWSWDFDNDGYEDILVSGYYGRNSEIVASEVAADYLGLTNNAERPRLYRNNGDETFSEIGKEVGLNKSLFTMGCNFGDINNDGWLDMYFGTGEFNLRAVVPNRMFLNDQGKYFHDVTTSGGFGQIQKGHGISFGDIDNDGDQDIYTVIGGALQGDIYPNMLFENPGNSNNWISIQLSGESSNKKAIGARLTLRANTSEGTRVFYRTLTSGSSFGANSLQLEIGLGNASSIEEIEVQWPNSNRSVDTWQNIKINQTIFLQESKF